MRFHRPGTPASAGGRIRVHRGEFFGGPVATGELLAVDAVRLLISTQPSKVLAPWNTFGELAAAGPVAARRLTDTPTPYIDSG